MVAARYYLKALGIIGLICAVPAVFVAPLALAAYFFGPAGYFCLLGIVVVVGAVVLLANDLAKTEKRRKALAAEDSNPFWFGG